MSGSWNWGCSPSIYVMKVSVVFGWGNHFSPCNWQGGTCFFLKYGSILYHAMHNSALVPVSDHKWPVSRRFPLSYFVHLESRMMHQFHLSGLGPKTETL